MKLISEVIAGLFLFGSIFLFVFASSAFGQSHLIIESMDYKTWESEGKPQFLILGNQYIPFVKGEYIEVLDNTSGYQKIIWVNQ